jgi:NAD(P)-dependent dehydrogenase (short-subunit alcohol dehydrogenase family)
VADCVVAEIRAAGGEAIASHDDVATVAGGRRICQTALDTFERVDVLVNNAGILRDKSFQNTSEELWDPVIAVHLKGTYCVTHPVYRHMKERGAGGSIVNTSSTSGLNGNFGQCNYGAAKAGIFGLSRCLSIEGQKYRIRVNVLAPVAWTRLTEDLPGFEDAARQVQLDPKLVSPLVVYLASDLAKEVTGRTFFVGGGRVAEMRMLTTAGVAKSPADGPWTPEEIAARMTPGQILLQE